MKKFQLFFAFLLVSFVFVSCGDDVDCTESVLEMESEPLYESAFDASDDYIADPSDENCKSYKDALEELLDFIKDRKQCAEESGEIEDYNEAVSALEGEIDALSC
ncbi:MAG: hypothetical protein HKO66_11270 [Saprospiraceae bacterium]|nr:hypothetical protein [Bacteroidia bacterium]NNL92806.1 hypothetical protein [Saprospiraceae bacterium]